MSNDCKNKLLLVILRLMTMLIVIAVLLMQEMNSWTTTTTTICSTNHHRRIKRSNVILLLLHPGQKTNPYFHSCVKTRKNANSNNNNYNNNSTGTKWEEDPCNLINNSVLLRATDSTFNFKLRRRDALFLHRNMFLLYIVSLQQQSTALSTSTASITSNNILPKFYYYHFYYDIPSKPPNFIRIYLIRHGQTENNRLNIVQGAHVDTSLNDLGKLQAKQLGQALSRLQEQQHHHHRNLLFVHSMYQRSKETATIAASTYSHHHLMNTSSIQLLPSIRTIDFGLQEKKRYEMNQIYSSWSLGLIDVKLADGESCRQVMERIVQSFHSFVTLSKSNDSKSEKQQESMDIVAISHRKFIRMMLAIALDMPLFQAFTTLQQRNGCLNILDISTTENITLVASQSKLFLGGRRNLLSNDRDFQMIIPKMKVVKVDDMRHLNGYM